MLLPNGNTYKPIQNIKSVCKVNRQLESDWELHDCRTNVVLYKNGIIDIIAKCSGGLRLKERLRIVQNEFTSQNEYGSIIETEPYTIPIVQGSDIVGYLAKNDLKTVENLEKYKVTNSRMVGIAVGYLDEQGMSLGINRFNIVLPNQVPKGSFPVWMLFDTIEECESFISYCYTKLVRFLYFIGICGSAVSKNFFGFVPCPDKFDHIFTDQELYQKYGLTQEEINIIESVIKERK